MRYQAKTVDKQCNLGNHRYNWELLKHLEIKKGVITFKNFNTGLSALSYSKEYKIKSEYKKKRSMNKILNLEKEGEKVKGLGIVWMPRQ